MISGKTALKRAQAIGSAIRKFSPLLEKSIYFFRVPRFEKALSYGDLVLYMQSDPTNGIKLITDKSFDPPDACVFFIEPPMGGQSPFGPKKAIMRWFQKVMKGKVECVVCGLEFI